MPKKRKTLPKDFAELLKSTDIQSLIQLFNKFELDARGGYGKGTALSYTECPHELAKWLVEQGLDIDTPNDYSYTPLQHRAGYRVGNIQSLIDLGANIHINNKKGTPLHCAVQNHQLDNIKILLKNGAEVNAVAPYGYTGDNIYTVLELNLLTCRNADITNTTEITKILLNAGAQKTERMKTLVAEIGKEFEYFRPNFNPDFVDETSDALDELYQIFGVTPAAKRVLHNGEAPILVKSTTWKAQHQELWELLVPAMGQAKTVQGEVIRIGGKVSRELFDNGGINWDDDYKIMVGNFIGFVKQGQTLTEQELAQVAKIVVEVQHKKTANLYTMVELGVKWVLLNPNPIPLLAVNYER